MTPERVDEIERMFKAENVNYEGSPEWELIDGIRRAHMLLHQARATAECWRKRALGLRGDSDEPA